MPKNIERNGQYENCSHFWDSFYLFYFYLFRKMIKNTFKPCSHIRSTTQNPNPVFKITIYYTKYTNNVKILSTLLKMLEKTKNNNNRTFNFLFGIIYKFHNSYFVFFVIFVIWGFFNIYIYNILHV